MNPIIQNGDDILLNANDPLIKALPEWKRQPRPLIAFNNHASLLGKHVTMYCRVLKHDKNVVHLFVGDGSLRGYCAKKEPFELVLDSVYKLEGFFTMRSSLLIKSSYKMPDCGDDSLLLMAKTAKMATQNPTAFYGTK